MGREMPLDIFLAGPRGGVAENRLLALFAVAVARDFTVVAATLVTFASSTASRSATELFSKHLEFSVRVTTLGLTTIPVDRPHRSPFTLRDVIERSYATIHIDYGGPLKPTASGGGTQQSIT